MEKNIKTKSNEVTRSNFSKSVAKYLPDTAIERLKKMKNEFYYIGINFSDFKKNIRDMNNSNISKTLFNVLIDTHIIEKGLSHENIRYNFGNGPLKRLAENLNGLILNNMTETAEFRYAISTLSEYYKLHDESDVGTATFIEIMGKDIISFIMDNDVSYGGALFFDKSIKENNKNINYKELAENRFTIRNFDDSKVPEYKITEVIKIASKSPSACNRQSSRILIVKNEITIKQILEIQGGFRGYVLPSVLLVTVVDMRAYSNYADRHMAYIDGGLFTMSIVYGIEFEGLGACLLNTAFSKSKDETIRNILKMNKAERFISIIAVGNLKDKNKVAKSYRVDSSIITRVIE